MCFRIAKWNTGHLIQLEFQINNKKVLIWIYPMQYLEYIYTNTFFVTYLKTNFERAFCKFAEFGYATLMDLNGV